MYIVLFYILYQSIEHILDYTAQFIDDIVQTYFKIKWKASYLILVMDKQTNGSNYFSVVVLICLI